MPHISLFSCHKIPNITRDDRHSTNLVHNPTRGYGQSFFFPFFFFFSSESILRTATPQRNSPASTLRIMDMERKKKVNRAYCKSPFSSRKAPERLV